jgi:hypothetical protein
MRGNKKMTTHPPGSRRPTDAAVVLKTPTPILAPSAGEQRRARFGCVGLPRMTTDDPWRDLHPIRIWPD